MSAVHDLLSEVLGGRNCDVALLGSEGRKDLDLFVLANGPDPCDAWRTIESFLPVATALRSRVGLELIVRHEHRTLLPEGSPALHLLFYPSLEHLRSWETPSFLAYVHDRGRFLFGDRSPLEQPYLEYRRREPAMGWDVAVYHLMRYAELTIGTLIYIAVDSRLLSRSVLCENLLYSLRFTLTELFISDCGPDVPIDCWDWPELIRYIQCRFPHHSNLINLLENRNDVPYHASTDALLQIGFETLKLSARGLGWLPDLAMPKLL